MRTRSTTAKIRRNPRGNLLEAQAIDRTYHLHLMVDEMLDDHPAIEGDTIAEDLRDDARNCLWRLYQHLGGPKLA